MTIQGNEQDRNTLESGAAQGDAAVRIAWFTIFTLWMAAVPVAYLYGPERPSSYGAVVPVAERSVPGLTDAVREKPFQFNDVVGIVDTKALVAHSKTLQAPPPKSFVNFETPTVHPMALSPDGSTLAICNLADNRVEIFDVSGGYPEPVGDVPVGLDPVTVRFRNDGELW